MRQSVLGNTGNPSTESTPDVEADNVHMRMQTSGSHENFCVSTQVVMSAHAVSPDSYLHSKTWV